MDRLDNFIKKHQLLSCSQYGFRANRSTATLIDLQEITNCLDNEKYAFGEFVDLKKAFDALNLTAQ